jgi:hypothetical protein
MLCIHQVQGTVQNGDDTLHSLFLEVLMNICASIVKTKRLVARNGTELGPYLSDSKTHTFPHWKKVSSF